MSNSIIHLTDETFNEKVLDSNIPVLVDYWAEWCGPCKMIAPILESLVEEYDGKLVSNYEDDDDILTTLILGDKPLVILYNTNSEFDQYCSRLGCFEGEKAGVPRTAYIGIVSLYYHNQTQLYLAPINKGITTYKK